MVHMNPGQAKKQLSVMLSQGYCCLYESLLEHEVYLEGHLKDPVQAYFFRRPLRHSGGRAGCRGGGVGRFGKVGWRVEVW